MDAAGEIFRSNLKEVLEQSPSGADELHVLAVDDSLVDRKVIERLLRISSCKGNSAQRIPVFGWTWWCCLLDLIDSEAVVWNWFSLFLLLLFFFQ